MPRTRNPYPAEFREQMVALAQSGRSVEELAREFEPCVATIHAWIKQAERDGGYRHDGLTSGERDELRRLPLSGRCAGCLLAPDRCHEHGACAEEAG